MPPRGGLTRTRECGGGAIRCGCPRLTTRRRPSMRAMCSRMVRSFLAAYTVAEAHAIPSPVRSCRLCYVTPGPLRRPPQ
eukprot:4388318-Pyramimonas_sp.AAC.1